MDNSRLFAYFFWVSLLPLLYFVGNYDSHYYVIFIDNVFVLVEVRAHLLKFVNLFLDVRLVVSFTRFVDITPIIFCLRGRFRQFCLFRLFITIARLRFWQASIAVICLLERADKTELFLDGLVFYDISTVHLDRKLAILSTPGEFIEVSSFIVEGLRDFSHKTPELIIGFKEDSQFALLGDGIKGCQFKVQQNIRLIIILFISLKSCREKLVSSVYCSGKAQ